MYINEFLIIFVFKIKHTSNFIQNKNRKRSFFHYFKYFSSLKKIISQLFMEIYFFLIKQIVYTNW